MTCSIDACEGKHYGRGLCQKHYLRQWKHGDPTITLRAREHPATCTVEGCDKVYASRGLCSLHQHRMRTHGDVSKVAGTAPVLERFWAKVDTSGGPDACWPWTGSRYAKGYGSFRVTHDRAVTASRFAYELANGPLADGMFALHSCDNPPCCNARHLRAGTAEENTAEMVSKGRARNHA